MSEILYINACVRPNSRTKRLADCVVEKLGGEVKEVNLYDLGLSPLDMEAMDKREKASRGREFTDSQFDLSKQFSAADTIVIAAPYWDLSFPAVLKLYLENISVVGITFKYSENGIPVGLCSAQKLIYVTTAGGYIGENDFGFSYVKSLAQNLFGIKNVECVVAQGLDIVPQKAEEILSEAMSKIKENK